MRTHLYIHIHLPAHAHTHPREGGDSSSLPLFSSSISSNPPTDFELDAEPLPFWFLFMKDFQNAYIMARLDVIF